MILYISARRPQSIGSLGHIANSFLKFRVSKNSAFEDQENVAKNREKSRKLFEAAPPAAHPLYGTAPFPPIKVGAKCLSAVVPDNQDRALSPKLKDPTTPTCSGQSGWQSRTDNVDIQNQLPTKKHHCYSVRRKSPHRDSEHRDRDNHCVHHTSHGTENHWHDWILRPKCPKRTYDTKETARQWTLLVT